VSTRRAGVRTALGYNVVLVQDGHSTWDMEDLSAEQIIARHNRVLGSWFATVVPADSVVFAT